MRGRSKHRHGRGVVARFELSEARRVARERFRIEELRPEQERALAAVASGQDVLLVQPTGSGKSLAYQLSAMLLDAPTVVVSPLLALMADQEKKLRRLGLPVARLDSTVGAAARRDALSAIARGGPRVVLTTPETLRTEPLALALEASGVALLAVDEAHCISEWGHDFRPAYLRIPDAVERLRPRTLMALTATATPRVQQSIVELLGMKRPEVIAAPPHRPNLLFSVEVLSGTQKVERLASLVRSLTRPGIVYCSTVEMVDRLAAALRSVRVPMAAYHGRLPRAEKDRAQRRFMNPRRRLVMIATSAFGMGVDKPNIRYVVHYQTPGSLEQYVQEAGRAGRDGRAAQSILLFDPADLSIQRRLEARGRPSAEGLRRLSSAIVAWAREGRPLETCALALSAQVTPAATRAALAALEEAGLLEPGGRDRWTLASSEEAFAAASDGLARRFETLRREDEHRLETIEAYARTNECRSAFIRRYFGEDDPPKCGRCDRCVQARRAAHARAA